MKKETNAIGSSSTVHDSATLEAPVKLYRNVDIGANCHIGAYTYLRPFTYTSSRVSIGRFCSIGDFCIIGASKHPTDWVTTHTFAYDNKTKFPESELYNLLQPLSYRTKRETIIGSDVWIGSRAIIMQGVTIGAGAIIGANAIITKDVPPYAIVIEANKISRFRFQEDEIAQLLETKWWKLPIENIANMRAFNDVQACLSYLKRLQSK